MRLIDADALTEKCGDWYVEEGTEEGFIGTLEQLLSGQPEINCSEIPNSSDTISRQLLGTNLAEVGTDCISRQQVIESEAISKWKKEFREYVDSLDITRDDWKGIIEYIDELPSAEPDTTTHDSIPAKTGENDGVGTSDDCISRQQAIDALRKMQTYKLFAGDDMLLIDQAEAQTELMMLPSAQPERKTGRWIHLSRHKWIRTHKCDQCGNILDFDGVNAGRGDANFCPNCGADMRGEGVI